MCSHAGRAKSCKKDSRFEPFVYKAESDLRRESQHNSSKEKKRKPEIQIQVTKLGKISGAFSEITYIGIMLRPLCSEGWSPSTSDLHCPETNESEHWSASWGNHRWLLENWWRQVTVCTLDRCDMIRITTKNPPEGRMWVQSRRTKKQVTTRLGYIWPEEWSRMSKSFQRKAINTWTEEKIGRNERATRHLLSDWSMILIVRKS